MKGRQEVKSQLFGGRLVPSTLIGAATGAVMYVVGGAAELVGILPAGANIAFALIGFAASIGIGLYKDAKEAMKDEDEQKEEAK